MNDSERPAERTASPPPRPSRTAPARRRGRLGRVALLLAPALGLLTLLACDGARDGAPPATPPTPAPQAGGAELPNPASVNCLNRGGRLEMRKGPDGGESGYCVFPGGGECEEWALFRGTCAPPGE